MCLLGIGSVEGYAEPKGGVVLAMLTAARGMHCRPDQLACMKCVVGSSAEENFSVTYTVLVQYASCGYSSICFRVRVLVCMYMLKYSDGSSQ